MLAKVHPRERADEQTVEPLRRRWRDRALFGDPCGIIRNFEPVMVRIPKGPATVAGIVEPERQMPDFSARVRVLTDLLERSYQAEGEPEGLRKLRRELVDARLRLLELEDERRGIAGRPPSTTSYSERLRRRRTPSRPLPPRPNSERLLLTGSVSRSQPIRQHQARHQRARSTGPRDA